MIVEKSEITSLIVAPGSLSHRFINGRQISLRTLVIIFFTVNLISLAAHNQSDLYAQMNNMPYSGIAKELAGKRIHQRKFEVTYETRSWIMSKVLLVLTVFYFSFALYFINYRRGLSYFDHLAVSFEFMTFATLVLTILSWLPGLIVSLVAIALLLYAFERNAYKQRVSKSVTNAALLVFLFYGVMLAYRATVFFATMLTL